MRLMWTLVRVWVVGWLVFGLVGEVKAQPLTVSGKIASIDPAQQRLKLRTGLFVWKEFEVTPDTRITAGQQSLQLEQLQRGHEATVEYRQENGKRLAQSIAVSAEDIGDAIPSAPAVPRPSEPSASQGDSPLERAEPRASPAESKEGSPSHLPGMEGEPEGVENRTPEQRIPFEEDMDPARDEAPQY